MKTILLTALSLGIYCTALNAVDIRWLGLDINTAAQDSLNSLDAMNSRSLAPEAGTLGALGSVPFVDGDNLASPIGQAFATSGTSSALTTWNINTTNDTLNMTMSHSINGAVDFNNFAGSEGVIYFYALTPATLTITYDYGTEETLSGDADFESYKASERGRSRARVKNNAFGLFEDYSGLTEYVNRDGSRSIVQNVGPADGLIALQFDFRILDLPTDTNIPSGFMNVSFSQIPEPSSFAALLGMGTMLFAVLRRRNRS